MAVDPKKAYILRLYQERVENSLWCNSQYDVANFANGCLQGRFLHELLQNADDAKATMMECTLKEKTLVIKHDGREFIQEDVEKIISFANQRIRDKSTNLEMTGYKGIGFKALLAMATKVHIISGGYSFRFDKDHWNGKPMPWEMIPIWTEIKRAATAKVEFIFELNDPNFVRAQFESFCKQPKPMLFLKNLENITFLIGPKTTTVVKKDLTIQRQLVVDEKTTSEWLIKRLKPLKIPENVREALQSLNNTLCPERLKTAETVSFTFAFFFMNGRLAEPPQTLQMELFNTLPTKIRLGFPFAVNTEFLVEAQREQLVDHIFNDFLFETLARCQFFWLGQLAQEERWKDVLYALGPLTITVTGIEQRLCRAYEKGFESGYKNYAWIPSFLDPKKLLKLTEAKIDLTGFYSSFYSDLPPELIPADLVHPELNHFEKLKNLVSHIAVNNCLSENYILTQLEKIFQRKNDPGFCYRILVFFQKRCMGWEALNHLRNQVWIPTDQGTLGKLSILLLPPQNEIPLTPSFFKIPVMHPAIFSEDKNQELRKWLQSQGVLELSPKNIVGSYVPKLIQDKVVLSNEQHLELVRYLFRLHHKALIDSTDLKKLVSLPILTLKGTRSAIGTLYLSNTYNPDQVLDLESLFPNGLDLFVSSTYIENRVDILDWKQFFLFMGAHEGCDLTVMQETTVGELKKQNLSHLESYLKYLYNEGKRIIGRSASESDRYRNIIFFPMMNHLNQKNFSTQFWNILNSKRIKFIKEDQNCQFIDGNKGTRSFAGYGKNSYIKYILNHTRCLVGTDGKLHNAHELYGPAFKDVNFKDVIAADIDVDVSEELLEYLGFKTKFSWKECHVFLEKMRGKKIDDLRLYKGLIKNLVSGWEALEEKEKPDFLNKKWHFLAHNNTWQPVTALACFAVKGVTPSRHSHRWFKNVSKEMEEIAQIFKCSIFREYVDETLIKDANEDQNLRSSILTKLPLMAWMYAHHTLQSPEKTLKRLAERLKDLHIFKVSSIPTIENEAFLLDILLMGNRIYYTDRCKRSRLIEKVVESFELDEEVTNGFIEILSLKTERSTRKRKTVDDWIEENNIPVGEIKQLRDLLQTFDPTPNAITTPVKSPSSIVYSPHISTPLQENFSLPLETSMEEKNLPVGRRLSFDKNPEKTDPIAAINPVSCPQGPIQNISIKNSEKAPEIIGVTTPVNIPLSSSANVYGPHISRPHQQTLTFSPQFFDENSDWAPTVAIHQILPSQSRIQPLNIKKREKISEVTGMTTITDISLQESHISEEGPSPSKLTSHGSVKNVGQPKGSLSTQSKQGIGYWGEAFALKRLINHYEIKYQSQSQKISDGHYKLVAKEIELTIRWLNWQTETYNSYDIELTKKKIDRFYKRPIEIKTTQGGKIHFFLSQNERELLEKDPKNRLYLVLNAGNSQAEMRKICAAPQKLDSGIRN